MCGIVGYIGPRQASEFLVGGLRRLEYRGYDSSGVATISAEEGLVVCKTSGRIDRLEALLTDSPAIGGVGIGHTRWATHGAPSELNAHPQIGGDILKRFNEKPDVVNAALAHHGDIAATSAYTPLVAAADAMSASRPGARRETLERYIKRLEQLEGIAVGFKGIRQAYAIQAGREVRVIVDPEKVDDNCAWQIARDIAKKVEQELTYPGEIKVTLLREVRCVEFAR